MEIPALLQIHSNNIGAMVEAAASSTTTSSVSILVPLLYKRPFSGPHFSSLSYKFINCKQHHHHKQRQYSCSPSLQKVLFSATLFLFVLLVHKLQAAPPPAASVFLFPFSTKGPFQGHTFPLCFTSSSIQFNSLFPPYFINPGCIPPVLAALLFFKFLIAYLHFLYQVILLQIN